MAPALKFGMLTRPRLVLAGIRESQARPIATTDFGAPADALPPDSGGRMASGKA